MYFSHSLLKVCAATFQMYGQLCVAGIQKWCLLTSTPKRIFPPGLNTVKCEVKSFLGSCQTGIGLWTSPGGGQPKAPKGMKVEDKASPKASTLIWWYRSIRLMDLTILAAKAAKSHPNPISHSRKVPQSNLWKIMINLSLATQPCPCTPIQVGHKLWRLVK